MKKQFTILLLTLFTKGLHAQTFAEWFKQGKTQKKYLLQQLAALQVYMEFSEKGYAIAQTGLTAVGNIKKGDLGLHSDYFKSLQLVNPQIKNDARVAGILALDAQIRKVADAAFKQAKKSTKIAVSERAYIVRVLDNLVQGCNANITLLLQFISPDQLELTDDQRSKKVGGLYEDMEEKYAFARSFATSVERLISQRADQEKDIETEKNVLGIK